MAAAAPGSSREPGARREKTPVLRRRAEQDRIGFSAYPAEIEALLPHHGGLDQAAVIGVPDAALGEACWAYVVPRPGATVDPAGLISWARQNMSNYKVPRRVVVVDALPVNANGKVDKEALRRAATA